MQVFVRRYPNPNLGNDDPMFENGAIRKIKNGSLLAPTSNKGAKFNHYYYGTNNDHNRVQTDSGQFHYSRSQLIYDIHCGLNIQNYVIVTQKYVHVAYQKVIHL